MLRPLAGAVAAPGEFPLHASPSPQILKPAAQLEPVGMEEPRRRPTEAAAGEAPCPKQGGRPRGQTSEKLEMEGARVAKEASSQQR